MSGDRSQAHKRTSVTLTIDASGRAKTETRVMDESRPSSRMEVDSDDDGKSISSSSSAGMAMSQPQSFACPRPKQKLPPWDASPLIRNHTPRNHLTLPPKLRAVVHVHSQMPRISEGRPICLCSPAHNTPMPLIMVSLERRMRARLRQSSTLMTTREMPNSN